MRDKNYLLQFYSDLESSSITRSDFYIPSYYYSYSFNFMFNSSYNYYCKGLHKDFISFVHLNSDIDNFDNFNYIRLYDTGVVERLFINMNNIDLSDKSKVYNYISTYCNYIYYDGSFHETSSIVFNNNNYDDLVHSKNPSEYIISMLYIFLPVLLFIIGLKIFKKGLFK